MRIWNSRVRKAMRAAGLPTITELAWRAGLSVVGVSEMLNYSRSALKANGEWTPVARAVSRVLGMLPDELFGWRQYTAVPVTLPAMSDVDMDADVRRAIIARVLDTLHWRERAVVVALFLEGKSTKECAADAGITRAYVSMLLQRAMRRLRRPERLAILQEVRR